MNAEEIRAKVDELMPQFTADLGELVKLPSVAFPGFPSEPVNACAEKVVDVLHSYGCANARLLEIPGGYPAVWCEISGPEGSPTVLMYGHYDVQPAPAEAGWRTDPWTPTIENGRMYGRGAADDKSAVIINGGSIAVFGGKPPVNVKICLEGEEETISHLETFVEANPQLFECDVFLIADMGNLRVGEPALTETLRGDVACTIEVRTLEHPLHSGVFGGPAPDALMALIRICAQLVDEGGSVAVPGVESFEWPSVDLPEEVFRANAGVLEGVELIGSGSIGTRLWSKPSINVLGIDCPSVAEAANILIPEARAKISMRIVPGSDPQAEIEKLADYLRSIAPWNAHVDVRPVKALNAFRAETDGPAFKAAGEAMRRTWGVAPMTAGSGGSIPLLGTLAKVVPHAEFILWGGEDMAEARIHGANESIDLRELADCVAAQANLLHILGEEE
jgi:acetylornithine deacetylase/succinyl-diaminopimelate desuccinylase-like protein